MNNRDNENSQDFFNQPTAEYPKRITSKGKITTVDELRELAKEKNIFHAYSMNKLQLVVATWRFLKKDDLLFLAKEYYRVIKTSTMNKGDLIKSILDEFSVVKIKKMAKVMKITGYSTLTRKIDLINHIVDYDFSKENSN